MYTHVYEYTFNTIVYETYLRNNNRIYNNEVLKSKAFTEKWWLWIYGEQTGITSEVGEKTMHINMNNTFVFH